MGNTAHALERFNISSYQWWNEALHGVGISTGVRFNGKVRNATSFPQVSPFKYSLNRINLIFHFAHFEISPQRFSPQLDFIKDQSLWETAFY
jgi:hypothetical protein